METITVIVPHRHGSEPNRSRFPAYTIFSDDEGKGKKFALHKAIAAATTEYVWLTDDDVIMPADIQKSNQLNITTDADMLILPLAMNKGTGSLIEKLQVMEYTALQSLTLFTAEKGHPIMCSGANLIVKRERWLESYNELHNELPSGDDMFLLESFKRRGLKISTSASQDLTAHINPQPTLKDLLRQRMRWAGKANKYTDRDIIFAGLLTLLANICLYLPPVFICKYIFDLWLIHRGRTQYHLLEKKSSLSVILTTLFIEMVYPIYMLMCLFGGLFRQNKW